MYLLHVSIETARGAGQGDVQVFDVLEAVSKVAKEGVVEMLEHTALANYITDALRSYHCCTMSALSGS